MIEMTRLSELPVTDPAGTTGFWPPFLSRRLVRPRASLRGGTGLGRDGRAVTTSSRMSSDSRRAGRPPVLSNNPDIPLVQFQTGRLELAHELMIVSCDHDRRAEPVQLDEEP